MAKMIQLPVGDVSVPKATAQDVQRSINGTGNEQTLKLSALGLLVNLASYPPTWELSKTELYKRFAHDGEKSVKSAWRDLEEANYIIEFKYRVGKKYEYVYYFRMTPFSKEEKEQILKDATQEYGEIWGLRNGVSNLESPKRTGKLSTLKELKSLNKEEEEIIYNARANNIVYEILEDFFKTKGIDQQTIDQTILELTKRDLNLFLMEDVEKQFKHMMDKLKYGEVDNHNGFAVYFANGLQMRSTQSKASKQYQQEKIREYELAMQKKQERAKNLPYYDWLNE